MADHSSDSQNEGKRDIRRFPFDLAAYIRGFADQKMRMRIHTLSRKKRRVHVGELGFGQWYLVHGIGPRYLVRRVDPRYLVQGIGSKWFWTMVLSKA